MERLISWGKDEWEPKEPQLRPLRARPDPQALKNPRPETDVASMNNIVYVSAEV